MSDFEIKLINKTNNIWKLPRSHHANLGIFQVRAGDELEFSLQPFSQQMYGAYRSIELSQDSEGKFEVKTKKRKNYKPERFPGKFYIALKNISGVMIESINLDRDTENVRLPLGIALELEISPFANCIIYKSIEIFGDEKTRLSTNDSGYGLGHGKYMTIYQQRVKRVKRSDEEMERVRKIRMEHYEERLDRSIKRESENTA